MGSTMGTRVLRLAAAALGIAALVTALVQATSVPSYFSFFTIESNILAAVLLLGGGIADPRSIRWAYYRGAVTLYMTITGIIYAALLANEDVGLIAPWVNVVLHRVLPVLVLLDWLVRPPWPRVPARAALGWLAFPLAYLAYTLIRGPHANFYPYPFMDPRPNGYDHVVVYAIVLAAGMSVLALVVWRIGALRLESGAGEHDVEPRLRPRAG